MLPVSQLSLALAALVAFAPPAHQDVMPQKPADLIAGQPVALAYSGFRAGQHPDRGDGAANPSRAEVLEDLQILAGAGVGLVRLYDSGPNSQMVLEVIKAEALPIKVLLGAWLRAEVSNHAGCPWLSSPIPKKTLAAGRLENATEIGRAISLATRFPEAVAAINVGNEAMVDWNDHMVPPDRVIPYIRTVRAAVSQPVTVADNYLWWTSDDGKRVAAELDFIGVHSYPVWEGHGIEGALERTAKDIALVQAAHPGKPLAVLEAGWTSTAAEFGPRASEAIQTRYVTELCAWAQTSSITVFLFEAFDEPWKGDPGNPAGAEKHWGLWNVDRTPKPAAEGLRGALEAGRR